MRLKQRRSSKSTQTLPWNMISGEWWLSEHESSSIDDNKQEVVGMSPDQVVNPAGAGHQFQRFLVYCDFIRNASVTAWNTQCHYTTQSLDRDIKSMEIEIFDGNGDPVDFAWGSTCLQLRFRRRNPVGYHL